MKDAGLVGRATRKHEELRDSGGAGASPTPITTGRLRRPGPEAGLASRRDSRGFMLNKILRKGFTRTELDVLSHLDADGSGCVDVNEFTTWLSQGRSDFVVEEKVLVARRKIRPHCSRPRRSN